MTDKQTGEQEVQLVSCKGVVFVLAYILLLLLVLPLGCVVGAVGGLCLGAYEGMYRAASIIGNIFLRLRWGKDYESD